MGAEEVFKRMREDHRRVLERVAALEAMTGSEGAWKEGRRVESALSDMAALIDRQFATHMAAEDEVLFPALLESLPEARSSVAQLESEHRELREMMDRLRATLAASNLPDREEQIHVQLRDFIDLLRIHIRKEEAVVISVAERILRPSDMEALAARMSQPPGRAGGQRPPTGWKGACP